MFKLYVKEYKKNSFCANRRTCDRWRNRCLQNSPKTNAVFFNRELRRSKFSGPRDLTTSVPSDSCMVIRPMKRYRSAVGCSHSIRANNSLKLASVSHFRVSGILENLWKYKQNITTAVNYYTLAGYPASLGFPIIHPLSIIKFCEELVADVSLMIVTDRRRCQSASNTS